jgi:hypothetical protein
MVMIPLASKSDPATREVVTSETLINLFAVKAPEGARAPFYLNRTPGMTAWSRPSSDICRGLFACTSTLALGVYGGTLFKFNAEGGPTSIGSITGTDDVRFAQNNANEVVIATGTTAYQYDIDTNTLSVVSDGDLPSNPVDVISLNGYVLYIFADRRVFYTPVNDANNIDALDFFTVPGKGDLVAGAVLGPQIIFWGQNEFTIYNHVADDADEPFQLVRGAGKPFGCLNKFANFNVGGLQCFVDQYGSPRTIGQGYAPQGIGNEGVQSDILAMTDKDELRLFGYVTGDRGFLVVRSSEFTWVYDFKEQRWHNRESYQRVTWQAKHYMRFADYDLVAPDMSGDLFRLDDSSYSEDGAHIVWQFDIPPVTNFPDGGTVHGLHFDVEVGTALGASAAAEDQEPKFTVYTSKDAGKTFGTGRQLSLGTRGVWRKRLTLLRCGDFGREGFIVRCSGSGKTPNAIMNLAADITPRAA